MSYADDQLSRQLRDRAEEIAELKAERDELREQNAALAARNAELHDVAGILLCIDQCETCRVDGEFDRDAVKRVINREASASLARRDARLAYEAISAMTFPTMLRKMWSGGEVQVWLENEAEKHRQQAEGGS